MIADPYAYVAGGSSGLRIVDIANPASPREVGAYDTPGSAYGIAVASSYAYVADGSTGLRIVDITDPTSPREVGAYDTPGDAYSGLLRDRVGGPDRLGFSQSAACHSAARYRAAGVD